MSDGAAQGRLQRTSGCPRESQHVCGPFRVALGVAGLKRVFDRASSWYASCTQVHLDMSGHVWTIVLAAGEGRRLAAVTGGVPKQFWRPDSGAPTLLDSTIARVQTVAPADRTLTVVADDHRHLVRAIATPSALGRMIYQPENRGTAVGVLWPLVSVMRADPDAIIVMTPSDHGVEDNGAFTDALSRAIARVKARQSGIVLFGATPTSAAEDYGWVMPSMPSSIGAARAFRNVAAFVEKPAPPHARRLLDSGAVWNTMVIVARGRDLLSAFRKHLPFHAAILAAGAQLDSQARDVFLKTWYPRLPAADFSRDLLTPTRPLSLFTWPLSLGWSDLGTPQRLEQWLKRPAAA